MRIGPYVLETPIAAGGVGEVWRSRYDPDADGVGTPVAVKLLTSKWAKKKAFREAFLHEARATAALEHPHVLALIDYGLAEPLDGAPFLVMPWAEHSLAGRLPLGAWSEVRGTLEAVMSALAHAHARDVIHRDIKPANVLRLGGRWVVADWGIAATAERVGLGATAGTPGYMAPEQRRGDAQGPETDLYAVGVLAWELVCGAPEPRVWPMPRGLAVPEGLDAWVRRLLESDGERRFRSAAAARAALPDEGAWSAPVEAMRRGPSRATGATLAYLSTPGGPDEEEAVPVARPPSRERPLPLPAAPPAPVRSAPPLADAGLGIVAFRAPPWVGRDAERAALWTALRDVVATGTSRHVRLVGRPGVGRSRLAAWVAEAAHEAGAARTVRVAPRADGDAWVEAARALGLADADAELRRDDLPAAARAPLVRRVFGRHADDFPRVVIVDPPAADLPLAAGEPHPLLIVSVHDEGEGLPVPPLSDDTLAELARGWIDLDPAVIGRLVARAAGRPRALVDTVRAGVEAGRFHRGPHGWIVDAEAAVALGPAHQGAAAIADAIGPTVTLVAWERLVAVAGVPWDPGLPGRLVRLGLAWAPEPGTLVLTQPLAANALSPEVWRRLVDASDGLGDERVARLRIAAGDRVGGAELLARAARAYRRRGDFARAAVAADEALVGLGDDLHPTLRAALRLEQVEVNRLTGRPAAAQAALDALRETVGPGRGWAEVRARIAMNDAEIARMSARYDDAERHARLAVTEAEAAGDAGVRSVALAALGIVEHFLGRPAAAARFEAAHAAAVEAGDAHLEGQAAVLTALAHDEAHRYEASEPWARRAEAACVAHGLALLRPSALSLLAAAARNRGDLVGAIALYEQSADAYRRIGHVFAALSDLEVALLSVAIGDLERGREVWLRWRHGPTVAGAPRLRLVTAAIGARLALQEGDTGALMAALDGVEADAMPLGASSELEEVLDQLDAELRLVGEADLAARVRRHRARLA